MPLFDGKGYLSEPYVNDVNLLFERKFIICAQIVYSNDKHRVQRTGATARPFITQTGQLSIHAKELTLLLRHRIPACLEHNEEPCAQVQADRIVIIPDFEYYCGN